MKVAFLALACSATLMAPMATAQSNNCAEHARVVERLASGYGESRQSLGLGADGSVVEVFASIETGSWTITVTRAGGPTCLVASGQNFQLVEDELASLDPDA